MPRTRKETDATAPTGVRVAGRAGAMALVMLTLGCASANETDKAKWCGIGGGAAFGAIAPIAVGFSLSSGNEGGGAPAVLGILLAPVGAVVGGIYGAIANPCPEENPAQVEADNSVTAPVANEPENQGASTGEDYVPPALQDGCGVWNPRRNHRPGSRDARIEPAPGAQILNSTPRLPPGVASTNSSSSGSARSIRPCSCE